MKIIHVLYAGLGGHGNVFFSSVKANEDKKLSYEALFIGVEDIRKEYAENCAALQVPYGFVKKRKKFDFSFNKGVVNGLKNSPASLIFLHGSRFILLAKLGALLSKHKKQIVVRETQANHLKTKLDWIGLFLALFIADHIVFLTEAFKTDIQKKFGRLLRPSKTSVIGNGLDLDLFKPGNQTNSSTVVVGMQSRILPIKDHITLLNAFALLQKQHPELDLQLKIAGDGESLADMKLLAATLHIDQQVEFTGMLNEADLVHFMQSLDIYVHASLGETMSTSVMQAMACRLPIIASDVPGINNMIEHNITGVLVPVKNEQILAAALSELIAHPEKAMALKAAAFSFAHLHYGSQAMSKKYFSLFERIRLHY